MRQLSYLRGAAEAVAATLMAVMFLTFILQIGIRYSARLEWVAELFLFLEPTFYGWTLELCLVLWVWLVFWGNAFVVRERDHVAFDILYERAGSGARKWFVVVFGLAIATGLILSIELTWAKLHILRLKRTATLSGLVGDWIRMRHIYAIYFVFLAAVSLRYLWVVYRALRFGAPDRGEHEATRFDE